MSKPDRDPEIRNLKLSNGMSVDIWINQTPDPNHPDVLGLGPIEHYELDDPDEGLWDEMLAAISQQQAAHA